MKVLILRLLSMFLWSPGMLALESELMKFLCSVSSLCECEAVHHKSDGSLWAVLSSAAEDTATLCSWCAWVPCTSWWSCFHQLYSFSVFVVGVTTDQCSWSCSSSNHLGGIADTVGPQLEDLQHCCLGECYLNNSAGRSLWRKCGPLVWLHKDGLFLRQLLHQCTRLAKISGTPWVCLQLQSVQIQPPSRWALFQEISERWSSFSSQQSEWGHWTG